MARRLYLSLDENRGSGHVPQSSSRQVLHNRESQMLQYAMRERLVALGWSEIEIVDDDLGRSAVGRRPGAHVRRMSRRPLWGR